MILDCFDVLMLKIIFKNKKNVILMHFQAKIILKNNRYHTSKQPLCQHPFLGVCLIYLPAQLVLKFIYPLDF
jgi:hypothetical protein